MEKRIFNKGMNGDLAVEFIPQGQYRTALNVRVGYSDNDNMGTVENALGNSEVTSIDIPYNTGVYKCIGSKLDPTANKIYGFLFNSIQAHRIIEYDISTNSIATVLESSVLNFDPDFLITGIAIVYLESDVPLLYWTDGGAPNGLPDTQCGSTVLDNPIRKLNINKAKEYTLGNPNPISAYQTIDVQIMDYIKWPPVFSPDVQIANDTTQNKNNIKGNLFQFRTAWRYDDFERTAWSPISKVVTPVGDESLGNITNLPPTSNNAIDITFDTGSEVVNVLYIAVRRSNNGGADTEGDFYLIDSLNKFDENGNVLIPSNTTYTYRFYNDKALLPIPLREQDLEFDNIPIYAQALEYIYGNRMVMGNCAEQFDLVTPNVKITTKYTDLPTAASTSTLTQSANTVTEFGIPIIVVSFNTPVATNYQAGDVLIDSIYFTSYTIQAADLVSDAALVTAYTTYLAATVGVITAGNYIDPTTGLLVPLTAWQFALQINSLPSGLLPINVYSPTPKISSFKSGATHPLGIRYYERANRASSVIRNDLMSVYVDSIAEMATTTPYIKQIGFQFDIRHVPPIWATHYQIVYAKNSSIKSFIQFTVRSSAPSTNGTLTEINIETITEYSTNYPNSILAYTFTSGDRVRLLYKSNTNIPYQQYFDVNVTGFDEGTQILSIDKLSLPTGVSLDQGDVIEIYSPKENLTDEQTFYYEISEEYEIGDAGLNTRYHKGELQDQDPLNPITTPAIIDLDRGDVWLKLREMPRGVISDVGVYWVEDYNFSDFYSSIVWDKGRASIFNPDFKRVVREANIVYSEPFLPETNLNGLSRVYDSSFRQYERKYRGIQLLKNKNRNLTVFQELKTGMLMINQQVARDSNGGTFVLQTDDVLNPMTYYEKESGIGKNPESYAEDRGNMYYVDVLRGEIIRLGQDGMNVISDRGMHNYFKDLLGQISKSGRRVNIYGCFNKRFGQYEIAFEQTRLSGGNNLQAVTLAYFEPENYWSSFYSYNPENMCNANDDMVSFKNGRVWVHNTGQYANYYGTQYVASLKAVSNAAPSETKVYETFTVEGTQAPNVPSIQSSLQQNSLLTPQMFRLYEGKYYTNFKRDLGTVGVQLPLLNGNRLRGRWLVVNIEMGTNTFSRLYAVNFNFVNSPINGI
jgi:hypothetical protein